MGLLNVIRSTLRSIGQHATRSALTMLGVNIGVVAVVAMFAAGQGARDVLKAQHGRLGTTVIVVFPQALNKGGQRMESGGASGMTAEDTGTVGRGCAAVIYDTPTVRSAMQIRYDNRNSHTSAIRVIDPESPPFCEEIDNHSASKLRVSTGLWR